MTILIPQHTNLIKEIVLDKNESQLQISSDVSNSLLTNKLVFIIDSFLAIHLC